MVENGLIAFVKIQSSLVVIGNAFDRTFETSKSWTCHRAIGKLFDGALEASELRKWHYHEERKGRLAFETFEIPGNGFFLRCP